MKETSADDIKTLLASELFGKTNGYFHDRNCHELEKTLDPEFGVIYKLP